MPYPVGLVFRDGKPLTYDSGDYPACQAKAVELADYANFPTRQAAAREEGRYIGIGVANYVEGSGLGPFEGATVRVLRSGKVRLLTGAAASTSAAYRVAGCAGDRRPGPSRRARTDRHVMADTDAIAMGSARSPAASPPTRVPPSISRRSACAKIIKLAAHLLEAAEHDIELDQGRAFVRGVPQMGKSFAELASASIGIAGLSLPEAISPGLEETHYFAPAQATYCNGTHIAEVEVDIATCHVRILNYVGGHDSGIVINPLIVDGQIQGGVAHGIGNALFEAMSYDAGGQPLTTTFGDYLLPIATDVPAVRCVHLETPTPLNPLGVKGAGEGGTIPAAAAIIAAIENALTPFGTEISEVPVRPDRLHALLAKAGAYAKRG
jgi:carbon-monoxide dehydrogenase large subunit